MWDRATPAHGLEDVSPVSQHLCRPQGPRASWPQERSGTKR